MQLHSIGLFELNGDGTKKISENGQEIPSYSNDDVQAFARVWTGSDSAPSRGDDQSLKLRYCTTRSFSRRCSFDFLQCARHYDPNFGRARSLIAHFH